jgi:Cu/Ag efflux protein CusF
MFESRFRRNAAMRFVVATLLATASFLSPISGFAESADVEATIKKVDMANLSLTLDDGKTYQASEEFNFEGLKAGVKVIVFYTEVDGKRVINDLDIVQ